MHIPDKKEEETRVIIPPSLIERLKGLGPHFCLVEAKGKSPAIGGKGWQQPENLMTAADPRLQEHLERGGNYGIVGGFGLVILDADTDEIKQVIKEQLPATYTVESPGSKGWHCYYLCALEKPIRLRDKNGINLGDIQGQNKMCVGPGSIHPKGDRYKVIEYLPFAQVTADQLRAALREYIIPEKEFQDAERSANDEKKLVNFDINITDVVPVSGLRFDGEEYHGAHPVHGSGTGQNFWVNPSKNVWHCFRHSTGGGPLLWLAVQEGLIDCAAATSGALTGPIFKEVLKKAVEKGLIDAKQTKPTPVKSDTEPTELNIAELFKKGQKIAVYELAHYIMENMKFITFIDNEECYYYEDGIYKPKGNPIIKERARDLLGDRATTHIVNEIINTIKDTTHIDRNEVNTDPRQLCVENGILNIFTDELTEHDPDHIFFSKLPVKYVPDAECPMINKFLKEVLYQEDIPVIEELVGYCFYPQYIFHKAFMFVGVGRNGKGTLLRLIEALLGAGNYSSESLYMLNSDRFSAAELFGKMANLCGDMSSEALKYTDKFKSLTGNDIISAQKKNQPKFTFRNYAKLIFSTNKPPEVDDDSLAFWERWVYFIFPHVFIGPDDDKQLDKKLQTSEELSGLLNLALKGLKRLFEKSDFSYSKSTEEIKEEWTRVADSAGAFVIDMIEYEFENKIRKKELYEEYYLPYCKEMGYPIDSIFRYEDFCDKLLTHCRGHVKTTTPRKGDKRYGAWQGIKIKSQEKKDEEIKDEQKGDIEKYLTPQKETVPEAVDSDVISPHIEKEKEEPKLEGLPKDLWDSISAGGGIKEYIKNELKFKEYDDLAIERAITLMITQGLIEYDPKKHYIKRVVN